MTFLFHPSRLARSLHVGSRQKLYLSTSSWSTSIAGTVWFRSTVRQHRGADLGEQHLPRLLVSWSPRSSCYWPWVNARRFLLGLTETLNTDTNAMIFTQHWPFGCLWFWPLGQPTLELIGKRVLFALPDERHAHSQVPETSPNMDVMNKLFEDKLQLGIVTHVFHFDFVVLCVSSCSFGWPQHHRQSDEDPRVSASVRCWRFGLRSVLSVSVPKTVVR